MAKTKKLKAIGCQACIHGNVCMAAQQACRAVEFSNASWMKKPGAPGISRMLFKYFEKYCLQFKRIRKN